MFIVDSAFHIIFSSENQPPKLTCLSECKKVWWQEDLDEHRREMCPLCSGKMTNCVEGVHYNILATAKRDLILSDFTTNAVLTADEVSLLRRSIQAGARLGNVGLVKPAFEKRAVDTWIKK